MSGLKHTSLIHFHFGPFLKDKTALSFGPPPAPTKETGYILFYRLKHHSVVMAALSSYPGFGLGDGHVTVIFQIKFGGRLPYRQRRDGGIYGVLSIAGTTMHHSGQ